MAQQSSGEESSSYQAENKGKETNTLSRTNQIGTAPLRVMTGEKRASHNVTSTSSSSSSDLSEYRRRQQLKEASQRCRKRQKHEAIQYTTQINTLRHEINILKDRLNESSGSPSTAELQELVKDRFVVSQCVDFVRTKLEDHQRWIQDVRNLILAAPLLDYIIVTTGKSDLSSSDMSTNTQQTDLKLTPPIQKDNDLLPPRPLPPTPPLQPPRLLEQIDAWREQSQHGQKYSDVVVDRQLQAFLCLFNENAHRMLCELSSQHCQFSLRYQSRGWNFAGNALDRLLTFRAERVLPSTHAQHVAQDIWQSLERDDILRTFVPIIHDSVSVREHTMESLSRRLIQLTPYDPVSVLVTVESMRQRSSSPVEEWQVSIGSSKDTTLNALAMDCGGMPDNAGIEGSPLKPSVLAPSSPHSVSKRGSTSGSTRSTGHAVIDFLIAASCRQDGNNVRVCIVGSTEFSALVQENAHGHLLQYLISILPVFEEVCISPQIN